MTAQGSPKKEIIEFKNFMSPFERTESGSFLRAKWVTPSDVLQPVTDVREVTPPTAPKDQLMCIVNAEGDSYIISEDDANGNGLITRISSTGVATEEVDSADLGEVGTQGACFYPDQGYMSIIDQGGDYHTYDTGTNTFAPDVETNSGVGDQACIYSPNDKTVYFTTNNQIHKDVLGTVAQDVFALSSAIDRIILAIYLDYLVVFAYYPDDEIVRAGFWDRDTGNPIYDKNIIVGRGRLLGAGMVGDKLTACIAKPNSSNRQALSKVVSYQFDGGSVFREKDSVLVKNDSTVSVNTASSCDGEQLLVATPSKADTDHTTGVYSINENGQFSVAVTVEDTGTDGELYAVASTPNYEGQILMAYTDTTDTTVSYGITYTADRDSGDATLFADPSYYETQMVGDGFTDTKLMAIDIGFEELDATFDQSITISYRLKPDGAWTEIDSFDHTSYGSKSSKQIVKVDSTTPLPEFKEIQYQIKSENGAVITHFAHIIQTKNKHPIRA